MPKAFEISIASMDDYEELSELFSASYPALMKKTDTNGGYAEEELSAALPLITKPNKQLLSSNTFYVLRDKENKIMACGGWTAERPGDGNIETNIAHIRHFATHPKAVRKGYGRAIIEFCKNEARNAGCFSMECFSSLNAESFYAATGFVRDTLTKVTLKDDVTFSAILMKQDL